MKFERLSSLIPVILGFGLVIQAACGGDNPVSSSADTQLLFRITDSVVHIPDSLGQSYSVTFTVVPVVDSTEYNPTTFAYFFNNGDATATPVPSNELRLSIKRDELVEFRIEDAGAPGSFRRFDPDASNDLDAQTLQTISTQGATVSPTTTLSGTITLAAAQSPAAWPKIIVRYEIILTSLVEGSSGE